MCQRDADATSAAVRGPTLPTSLVLTELTLPCAYRAPRHRSGVPFLPATVTTVEVTTNGLTVKAKRPAQALTTQRSLQGCLLLPHLPWPELRADDGEAGDLRTQATRRGVGHVERSAFGAGQPRHVSLAA